MRPEETIIYSDLDGTLFNSRQEISWENLATVSDYIDKGGMFAVATGRAPQNALRFFWGLRQNAPAIVMNGVGVYDFSAGEYLYCEHMDRSRLEPYLRFLLERVPGLELQVYSDREILYCLPEEQCQRAMVNQHRPCRFTSFDDAMAGEVIKCIFLVTPDREEELRSAVAAAPGDFRPVPGELFAEGQHIRYYEIMPGNLNKGSALQKLRSSPLLAGRTVITAGDNWNDLELLQAADISVTPSNAVPELKQLSHYVLCSNDEHLIAHIIGDLIPKL